MLKEELSKEIQFLAYSGWSPKEIEEKLGLEPYTIHIHHHEDLMIGYERHIARYKNMPGKTGRPGLNMTNEQKAERRRLQIKQSYLKRKAAGKIAEYKKEYYKRRRLEKQVEAQHPTP